MIRNLFVSLFTLSCFSWAQNDELFKVKIEPNKPLRLNYKMPAWNKNPNEVDHAYLIFRDGISGRVATIEVQETGKNTGEFLGMYTISFATDGEIKPEIYVPPAKTNVNAKDQDRWIQWMQEGRLPRKPFFLRKDLRGIQIIAVFDSADQALSAYDEYRKTAAGKPVVNPAALELQRAAGLENEQKRLADLARQQELDRMRLEEFERLKKEEMKKQQERLNEEEKARRRSQAEKLANVAMGHFQKGDFKLAEESFSKAIEFDPSNNQYYFQYGVALYRNEKYNQSIVALNLAKDGNFTSLERDYFLSLNLMKLKEFDRAYEGFSKIKETGHKSMGPSGAFFCGLIDFVKERYDRAQAHFQYVLDNSEDTQLDEQAESYIEQIANIKSFLAAKGKPFVFTVNWGLVYDSNILSTPTDSVGSTTTDLAGFRLSYGGSVEWRAIYEQTKELSLLFNISDMYSMDSKFAAYQAFQNTDPLIYNLSAPFKWKGKLWNKPVQLGATGSYESMMINSDTSTSARESYTNSTIFKLDSTFVMSEDHFGTYAFEIRNDTLLVAASSAADDSTAMKYTLSTQQTFFKDKKKTEASIYEGGIQMNNAAGDNNSFQRFDLAYTMMMPFYADSSLTSRFAFYSADYTKHTTGRKDTDYAVTVGARKELIKNLSGSLSLNYTMNNSTLSSSNYNKYSLTSSFSYTF